MCARTDLVLRFPLPAVIVALILGVVACSSSTPVVQQSDDRWKQAEASGTLVWMTPVGDRTIGIDGDLGDWGDLGLGPEAGETPWVLHQGLHRVPNPQDSGSDLPEADAALVRVKFDDGAILIAARVADTSITNPFAGNELCQGDCLALVLDLRPLTAANPATPLLYAPQYTEGVRRWLISPPTGEHPSVRVLSIGPGSGDSGSIEAAGARFEWGWQVELRVPLAALMVNPDPKRLLAPIGIEVMIHDLDRDGTSGVPFSRGSYSLTRLGTGLTNPGSLGVAFPRPLEGATQDGPTLGPFLPASAVPYPHPLPVVRGARDGQTGVLTGLALNLADGADSWPLDIAATFEATAFDQPDVVNIVAPDVDAPCIRWQDDYSALGLSVHGVLLPVEAGPWPRGRYVFQQVYPGAPDDTRGLWTYGEQPVDPFPMTRDFVMEALKTSWVHVVPSTAFPEPGASIEVRAYLQAQPLLGIVHGASVLSTASQLRIRWVLSRNEGSSSGRWVGESPLEVVDRPQARTPQPMPMISSRISIPGDALSVEGGYQLSLALLDESGRSLAFELESVWQDHLSQWDHEVLLGVKRRGTRIIRAESVDAQELKRRFDRIGNPGLHQFPVLDERDARARTVHALQAFEGRIYVGTGEWADNRGPVTIWSFLPPAAAAPARFDSAFAVDDESVDRFRVIDGKLFVPGLDAMESWDLGNLYVKDHSGWRKLRTIPNGVHVLDVARFSGRLYVTTGTNTGAELFASEDEGLTWDRVEGPGAADFRFHEIAPLRDRLLVTSGNTISGPYQVRERALEPLVVPLWPNTDQVLFPAAFGGPIVERLARHGDGVIYTGEVSQGFRPLMVLRDLDLGAEMVDLFADREVRDIVVEDERAYVLSVTPSTSGHGGEVHASEDLVHWERLASFDTPALPKSLAVLHGQIFVGLGVLDRWQQAMRPPLTAEAIHAAGLIGRLR